MDKLITKQPLAGLKPHPLQAELFGDEPRPRLRDLAEDMRANGLREPVEILPDGTVICGHQRVRAAEMLGWTAIDAWVRTDLADQRAAADQRFIEDNLTRRQLTPLAQARCYKRLEAVGKALPADKRSNAMRGRLRDVVGSRLGMSGRTLDRYVRVLDTPLSVQAAFERGEVKLVDAEKVAGLPAAARDAIAAAVDGGADAKATVAAALTAGRPVRSPLSEDLARLSKNLAAVSTATATSRLRPAAAERLRKVRDEIDRILGLAALPV